MDEVDVACETSWTYVDRFARIEASRSARVLTKAAKPRKRVSLEQHVAPKPQQVRAQPRVVTPYQPARFAVVRQHDGGQREIVELYRTWGEASSMAGRMRDGMTDAECALDYNYLAVRT